MNYTNLETEQINKIYKIINKHNIKLNIKNINNITNSIIHEIYTNKEVNNICNKGTIIRATLNKLYIPKNTFENKVKIEENKTIINNMNSKIDKIINKYENNLDQEKEHCKCIIC